MKHFWQKDLKTLTVFAKRSSKMFLLILNTPLEGFVEHAPKKKLTIVPAAKCLTTTVW